MPTAETLAYRNLRRRQHHTVTACRRVPTDCGPLRLSWRAALAGNHTQSRAAQWRTTEAYHALLFAAHSLCTENFVTSFRIIYDIRMIHYFIVYLITLSTKTKHCQILRCVVNNNLDKTRKETLIIQFYVLYWHFPESTEEEHEKSHAAYSVPLPKFEKPEVSSLHSVFLIELVRILNYWLCCKTLLELNA